MIKQKTAQDSLTIMTEMIMPNDTNPLGNLMGGNLLRLMDIAGGICAGKHCEAHVVTVSADHISFNKPIRLGDVITIKASVTRAFRTSVEVHLEVFKANIKGAGKEKTNSAFFSFVAIDEGNLKPRMVPELLPQKEVEKELYDGAIKRREIRLYFSGRIDKKEATNTEKLLDQLEKLK